MISRKTVHQSNSFSSLIIEIIIIIEIRQNIQKNTKPAYISLGFFLIPLIDSGASLFLSILRE
jgi:hypothetical protein